MKLQSIGERLAIVGTLLIRQQVPLDVQEAFANKGIEARRFIIFRKLFKKKNGIFFRNIYTIKKTNSTCAAYTTNDRLYFGIIRFFVRLTNCDCRMVCQCPASHYAVIKRCNFRSIFGTGIPRLELPFLHTLEVIIPNELDIIDVNYLRTVCFLVTRRDVNMTYIAEPVNTIEVE